MVISDADDAGMQAAGIQAGEMVIISDVVPVMEGLPLKIIIATDYEERLRLKAIGRSGVPDLTSAEALVNNTAVSSISGNN